MLAWTSPISFDEPPLLWLIPTIAVLVVWMARRSLAGLSPVRRWTAILTRIGVVALIVMAMAGAQRNRTTEDLTVIFALDISRSIPQTKLEQAWKFIQDNSKDLRAKDRLGVVTFDGQTYIDQLPQTPGTEGGLYIDRHSPAYQPDRTDIAGGTRIPLAMFPQDSSKRLVLLTDGNQTTGDVMTEIQTAVANGVAVDIVPIKYKHTNEVMFRKLQAPAYAHLDEHAGQLWLLEAQRATSGTVTLFHNGQPVDLDPQSEGLGKHVELQPGLNPLRTSLRLSETGAHRYDAYFQPDNEGEDVVLENNRATAFTNVEGPAKVLYLRHDEDERHATHDDQPLVDALRKENIEVEDRVASEMMLDAVELQQYAAVILANVPRDVFGESQLQAMATYVRDLGGGLIMTGGDDSFGAGGWQGSVVEEVMPVDFDVKDSREMPRGALAVLMHACEFPEGNVWASEVCIAAMKTLSRLDYFGVVYWGAGGYEWPVPMQLLHNKGDVERKIRAMASADMGDFHQPMEMAYKALQQCSNAAQKHLIIVSDGDPSPPSNALLSQYKNAKITVSTVSVFPHVGWMGTSTMEDIAKKTGGKHYLLNNSGDEKKLPQIFIKEAKIVRRPLLVEEKFTPRIQSGGSDLLRGIGTELPPLRGYVVTTPRSTGIIDLPLVSHKKHPLLAHWQCGLGRTVAFTSGWWNHWGPEWAGWESFGKVWAQTVRWAMAQGSAANYDVATRIEGDKGKVLIEALNTERRFLNFLRLTSVLVKPDGTSQRLDFRQTAPGRYEADFGVTMPGTYLVNVRATGGRDAEGKDEKPALIRTGVSLAYSPEYRELEANEAALRQMAHASPQGRMLSLDMSPEEADVFSHNLPETIARKPIWDLLTKLAVALFLVDVAVRRVAVDPRAVAKRMRAFITDLAGRFAPGRQAEAVLGDLKAARERVRSEKTGEGSTAALAAARGTTAEPAPALDRSRRFEAGERAATGDLRESLGAAKATEPARGATKPAKTEPVESTTARLLKAKRRTRPDTDEGS